jgi:ubiquitin-protein ligase
MAAPATPKGSGEAYAAMLRSLKEYLEQGVLTPEMYKEEVTKVLAQQKRELGLAGAAPPAVSGGASVVDEALPPPPPYPGSPRRAFGQLRPKVELDRPGPNAGAEVRIVYRAAYPLYAQARHLAPMRKASARLADVRRAIASDQGVEREVADGKLDVMLFWDTGHRINPPQALADATLGELRFGDDEMLYAVVCVRVAEPRQPANLTQLFYVRYASRWEQTARGMSLFLGGLYQVAHRTQQKDVLRTVGRVHRLACFPPLTLALRELMRGRLIDMEQMVALIEGAVALVRGIVPPEREARLTHVFEHSLVAWHALSEDAGAADEAAVAFIKNAPPHGATTCALDHSRLGFDAVMLTRRNAESVLYDRAAVDRAMQARSQEAGIKWAEVKVNEVQPVEPRLARLLATSHMSVDQQEMHYWTPPDVKQDEAARASNSCASVLRPWVALAGGAEANRVLCLYQPLAMKVAGFDLPALTLTEGGQCGVALEWVAKSMEGEMMLLDCAGARQVKITPEALAEKTQALFAQRGGRAAAPMVEVPPREVIIVLFDTSGSMNLDVEKDLLRIGMARAFFFAFSNRSMAYGFPHHIALVKFSENVQVAVPPTPFFDRFSRELERLEPEGGTAVYDAIVRACELLTEFKRQHAECEHLRVLCLSDGEDRDSKIKPFQAAQAVQRSGVVVDYIFIGNQNPPKHAHAIAKLSGGMALRPATLAEGTAYFESEPFLAFRMRAAARQRAAAPALLVSSDEDLLSRFRGLGEVFDKPEVAPMPEGLERASGAPSMNAAIAIEAVQARMVRASQAARARLNMSRLVQELRKIVADAHPYIHVFPIEDHFEFWRVVVQGPEGTPYEGGTWLLYAFFSPEYPARPPEIRFITPVLHCNVNASGKICHSVLNQDYNSATSVSFLLQNAVYGLMMNPEARDPVDNRLAALYLTERPRYNAEVARHTRQHASKKLEQLKRELRVDDA